MWFFEKGKAKPRSEISFFHFADKVFLQDRESYVLQFSIVFNRNKKKHVTGN